MRSDLEVLHAAVEASGEVILITSAELDEPGPHIEYVNPAFTRLTTSTPNTSKLARVTR